MTEEKRRRLMDNTADTFSYENHVRILEVSEEQTIAEVQLTEKERNIWNRPHGGVIFTLFDVACGIATIAVCDNEAAVTVSSNLQFLYSSPQTEKLIATAKVDRKAKTLAFCSGRITDDRGNLIATGETVMKYVTREP